MRHPERSAAIALATAGLLLLVGPACSENPLDPDKKGELKTVFGDLNALGEGKADDCPGACDAAQNCVGAMIPDCVRQCESVAAVKDPSDFVKDFCGNGGGGVSSDCMQACSTFGRCYTYPIELDTGGVLQDEADCQANACPNLPAPILSCLAQASCDDLEFCGG